MARSAHQALGFAHLRIENSQWRDSNTVIRDGEMGSIPVQPRSAQFSMPKHDVTIPASTDISSELQVQGGEAGVDEGVVRTV
jgi:hypothetical protein